jgi:ribosomal protein S18 acetylase RimI-like enzyme
LVANLNPVASKTMLLQLEATIRPATADDLPKLEWFGQYWRYRKIFEHTYQHQLRGRRLMLLADVNDFPVGQVFVQFDSREARLADGTRRAYLYSLRVMEPFRQRGLGTRLILASEEAIAARGYDWSTIAVAKDNPRAQRLYQRLDYQTFSDDPGRWSFMDPAGERHHVVEPAWLMNKRLRTTREED